MEKFALEKFEEVVECYFLPGLIGLILIFSFLDSCIKDHFLVLLFKNLSIWEASLYVFLSLIIGMLIDSIRHLLFERFGLLKYFGIPKIPILEFFDNNKSIIDINDKKIQWYRYFTRHTYYYAEFLGNIGLALLPIPLFLRRILNKYLIINSTCILSIANIIILMMAITSLIHYILSMKSYSEIIKKIKN